MKKLLVEETGFVPLPPAQVRRRLIALVSSPYAEPSGDGDVVVLQGGWWYRGEYALERRGQGTQVTHRVYNIASRGRWAVPLANRFFIGFAAKTREGFAELLRTIADQPEPHDR